MTVFTVKASGWDDGGWVYLIPDNAVYEDDLQKVLMIRGDEIAYGGGATFEANFEDFERTQYQNRQYVDSAKNKLRAYFVNKLSKEQLADHLRFVDWHDWE